MKSGIIMLFAGTTEGRQLCEYLAHSGCVTHVYVTTEYGEELLYEESTDNLHIHVGKLDRKDIYDEVMCIRPDIVIDATHPYAVQVTQNVRNICELAGVRYIRVLREKVCIDGKNPDSSGDNMYVKPAYITYSDTMHEVVELLNSKVYEDKKVLFTTGSNSIPEYVHMSDYRNRAYIRLLPSPDMLSRAVKAGFQLSHLIGMQGPFTQEFNEALIRQLGIDVLVTKESGSNGGYEEKIMAARQTGTQVIVIRRPAEKDGKSVAETIRIIRSSI